jgi:acyl-CoA thioesterase I
MQLTSRQMAGSAILRKGGRNILNRLLTVLFVLVLVAGMSGCAGDRSHNATPAVAPEPAVSTSTKAAETDFRPIIVALGDSLTAGRGLDPTESYPAQLQAKLNSKGYRYRVVNAGVSGDTSAQGLNRLQTVLSLKPVLVIVELGANDGLRGLPAEQTRGNLEEIVRTLKQDGVTVVLAGMEIPPNYGPEYTRQFRLIFRDIAAKYHAPLIPFFLQGVAGIPDLNQEDGIHPTAQGYNLVTENVWRVLEPLLKPGA